MVDSSQTHFIGEKTVSIFITGLVCP